MSRSSLGRRSACFFVRLHPEEDAALTRLAAQHGMPRADYARKRLLDEIIPVLPASVPAINYQTGYALQRVWQRLHDLHGYCSATGHVDWRGQEQAGRRVFEMLKEAKEDLARIVKAIPGPS